MVVAVLPTALEPISDLSFLRGVCLAICTYTEHSQPQELRLGRYYSIDWHDAEGRWVVPPL